jgi:hypothetical protein
VLSDHSYLDVTLLDFFLWSTVKEKVHVKKPTKMTQLQEFMKKAFHNTVFGPSQRNIKILCKSLFMNKIK